MSERGLGEWGKFKRLVCLSHFFLFCSFSLPSRLPLCPRGEPYRLAAWIVPPLYMPSPCVVWLNCHCTKHKREKTHQKGIWIYIYIYTEGEKEMNDHAALRMTVKYSSSHPSIMLHVCAWWGENDTPPHHPTSLFSVFWSAAVSLFSLSLLSIHLASYTFGVTNQLNITRAPWQNLLYILNTHAIQKQRKLTDHLSGENVVSIYLSLNTSCPQERRSSTQLIHTFPDLRR